MSKICIRAVLSDAVIYVLIGLFALLYLLFFSVFLFFFFYSLVAVLLFVMFLVSFVFHLVVLLLTSFVLFFFFHVFLINQNQWLRRQLRHRYLCHQHHHRCSQHHHCCRRRENFRNWFVPYNCPCIAHYQVHNHSFYFLHLRQMKPLSN